MLSINNFFGIDLERMPNHKSQYEKSDINIQGINYKEYSHKISPNCEDYFFHNLIILVFENGGTNFIFDNIPYDKENAVDIAFTIERDLFNNGRLDYVSCLKKHKKEFNDIFFKFEWKLEKVTVYFERWEDELSLRVFSKYHYDRDSEEVIPDSKIAEDGVVEYKFGSDFYPQGDEIVSGEQYFQEPLPLEDYTYRTIKIRIEPTEERFNEYVSLYQKSFMNEDVGFMGLIMDGVCVFLSPETHIVLPMTQYLDRRNLISGHRIYAYIKRINSINMDVYIEYILQIMTAKEKEETYTINKETIFEGKSIPSYIYELINQYKPNTQHFESTDKSQRNTSNTFNDEAKTKTISISFREYDLSSSDLNYLKNCADDESIEFKLTLKTDKHKREYIAVESINSDVPLSTEIKDECFIEDFKRHELLMQEEKTTNKCHGVLFHYQDANSEFSTSQRIFFHVKIYMPWTLHKETPIAPKEQQKVPNLKTTNCSEQKYAATLVGFKFCLKEDELEEIDRYFYDFDNIIHLRAENDNPFDTNAIAAFTNDGKKIAYVAKENAQILRPLLEENDEFLAKPDRFNFTTAVVRLSLPCSKSLEMDSLFSTYKPIEVYKAHYLGIYWGASDSLVERRIFNSNEQTINFNEILSLPIDQQNYLASEWKEKMHKVSVENPTNPGLMMTVHLDLSIYGTNFEDIDLSDITMLNKIEEDNKKTALFIRLIRDGHQTTPEKFIEEYCTDASEMLIQRLKHEYKVLFK